MLLFRRLRLHATNAIGLPRSAPPGGVVFGGILFPEGVRLPHAFFLSVLTNAQTELSVPAWTIQHDTALWGDPHVFRPERWLQPTDVPRLRRNMLLFGAGPRGCVSLPVPVPANDADACPAARKTVSIPAFDAT